MAQKWYQKASVQSAIIGSITILIIAVINIAFNWSQQKLDNDECQNKLKQKDSTNRRLHQQYQERTAEVQRLETLLTPFRTVALERYAGSETEALQKLAEKLNKLQASIEKEAKQKTFKPLSEGIKNIMREKLLKLAERHPQQNFEFIMLCNSPSKNLYKKASELVAILKTDITKSIYSNVISSSPYDIILYYPFGEEEIANEISGILELFFVIDGPIPKKPRKDHRAIFYIYFLGDPMFDDEGRVFFK